jgi:hypothetical protein
MVDYYDSIGFSGQFTERHLKLLVFIAHTVKIRIVDIASAEFTKLLEENPEMKSHFGQNETHGIISFLPGQLIFGINSQRDPDEAAASILEEIIHLRQTLYSAKHFEGSAPLVLQPQWAGLNQLVHEFAAKEVLRSFGGVRSGRSATIREVAGYAETEKDLELFLESLKGCSARAETSWERISIFRYMRCVYRIKNEQQLIDLTRPL